MSGPANIYTIPAGLPFAKMLARRLLEETSEQTESLPQTRILLPTRRACRTLREAFLQLTEGRPLLLPRMQALGDIDEEELSLSIAGQAGLEDLLKLKPGLSPLRRQLMLARTIEKKPDYKQGPAQAMALAKELGRLMDQIYTEGLDMNALAGLVPEDFADHWQITLTFLEILSAEWPKILEENGVMDIAQRRNALIETLAAYWQAHPPEMPVIAAGSTGSIPATARLLDVIRGLKQGRIILPGLDTDMDAQSWDAVDDTHPQSTLKHLLEVLDFKRTDVQLWPGCDMDKQAARNWLAGEVMRPAQTAHHWTTLAGKQSMAEDALEGLRACHCRNRREEAGVIALCIRETLQTPGKTVAVITPDRRLAREVALAAGRWGIIVDDSAGQSLSTSRVGSFLRLCLDACLSDLAPVSLLALLKHDLCRAGIEKSTYDAALQVLEYEALRGLKPQAGFAGLYKRLEEKEGTQETLEILKVIEPVMRRFIDLKNQDKHLNFNDFIDAHLEMAEALASRPDENGALRLWAGEDGETAAAFLSDLREQAGFIPQLKAEPYRDILQQLITDITIRPVYGTHPRVMILGQLEARLSDADLVILGGLNEGVWPPDPGHDPWMSRPMKKEFGLPAPERALGLAAHDFVQGFCAREVLITRAARIDGTLTMPARWLQRLETVLKATGLDPHILYENSYQQWLEALDRHEETRPYTRPEPRPPADKRPGRLSVTKIETWLQDPYSIYARYILDLEPLEPLEKKPGAMERGNLLHKVLEDFVTAHPRDIPDDAGAILRDLAGAAIEAHHDDPGLWSFWWPRFERITDWFIAHEKNWRRNCDFQKAEVKGEMNIPGTAMPFTLSGKADRIDRFKDGSYAIIDYKSGGQYAISGIRNGAYPQLPLEGFMALSGAFPGIQAEIIGMAGYWILSGSAVPGRRTEITNDLNELAQDAVESLTRLVNVFADENTPYYSLPRADKVPRFNDYTHLARVQEWTALDESVEDAA